MATGKDVAFFLVALLAEGVDRNTPPDGDDSGPGVALLAEGVDRNAAVCTSLFAV